MAKKRSDLQGIRGAAIVAVLLFHYFPKMFPNGYIGVDQFFVLSGYLMTMIFAGSKSSIIMSALPFYYRRIKRIIPLYLFVIVLVLMAVIVLLPPTFVLLNLESARAAALLFTNMATRSKENQYFVQLNQADDLFTHTWSLAVEFQFYLLVPFIFLIYQVENNTFHWIVILIIEAFSFTYYLVADPNVSFNSVFCRIWQFGIGIACYMISDMQNDGNESTKHEAPHSNDQKTGALAQEDDTVEKKMLAVLTVVVTVLLIALALSTYPVPKDVLRPFTTLLTGIVIAVGSLTPCCILTHRSLVFLGDISYALYLIHWPVFVLIKFYAPEKSSAYLFAICCCIAGATLLYYTFERWYLSLTPRGIYILIAAMYAIIAVLILKGEDISNRLYELRSDSSVNTDFVARRWGNLTIDVFCALSSCMLCYSTW